MAKTRKGNGPAYQPEQAVAPLMGALTLEGKQDDTSTLLQMVLQQMAAAEQERRLEMAALQSQLQTSQEAFAKATAEWQQELVVIKQENAEAINAVREQFQKLIEAKPVDRETWNQMYKSAMQQAQAEIARNHAKFLEDLETMPTGIVHNDEGKNIKFIINGVERIFWADRPTTVPQVFVEEWEKRKKMQKWVQKLDLALQSQAGAEGLDQSANDLAAATGRGPVWSEETGRL